MRAGPLRYAKVTAHLERGRYLVQLVSPQYGSQYGISVFDDGTALEGSCVMEDATRYVLGRTNPRLGATCIWEDIPAVVRSVTLKETTAVRVSTSRRGLLRQVSADGTTLIWARGTNEEGPRIAKNLGPGTYYFAVETPDATADRFQRTHRRQCEIHASARVVADGPRL